MTDTIRIAHNEAKPLGSHIGAGAMTQPPLQAMGFLGESVMHLSQSVTNLQHENRRKDERIERLEKAIFGRCYGE